MSRKRAANGQGNIKQRKDGRWEARVYVNGDRRSVYGKTQQEARMKLTELQRKIDCGSYIAPNAITVDEWLHEWLETFCKDKAPNTINTYRTYIDSSIVPAIGKLKLRNLHPINIQHMYNNMIDSGKAASTVQVVGAVLHSACKTAVKQGYLATNPCDGAEIPKKKKDPDDDIPPLTSEEITAFLAEVDNSYYYKNAFRLCLFAGLRRGECLGLTWDKIDFEKKTITVCQQLQYLGRGKGYGIVPAKREGRRTFVLNESALECLHAQRAFQKRLYLQCYCFCPNVDNYVFTNWEAKHLNSGTFDREFKKIATTIGRPDATPHTLRHTAATVAVQAGADPKSVQNMLGHSKMDMTMNLYAHTTREGQAATAGKMQAYFNSI